MSLKDSLWTRLETLTDGMTPRLLERWGDVQRRLDALNCSLANRAVPEDRRSRVSELSLRQKAEQAGQEAALRVVRRRRRTSKNQ
ncbi:MAG TPA: hypothetical protein VFN01_01160 [Marinobacter sp.]|uniref:hypothetical protein n=1 Tax=Marinobacter sp. TaxID=50741 RepID=UPI002D7F3129|nr:hypothetical protein [Marinobacter sp.]HET8799765.1 hypothetical protein [Marinobacter sp.]